MTAYRNWGEPRTLLEWLRYKWGEFSLFTYWIDGDAPENFVYWEWWPRRKWEELRGIFHA